MGNQVKTAILLAGMTVFLIVVGKMIGGRQGMLIAFVLAIAMNFFSYWFSDKLVLKMYRAQEVTAQQAPDLYQIVQNLTQRAGLPMPKIYIIPQEAPNAFATGRNPEHAVVAVTQGLLQIMDKDEVTGVLAHELGHVKNRDILVGTIAATMAGAIMILANMAKWTAFFGGGSDEEGGGALGTVGLLVMSFLAPIGAMIIQMAISRSREYLADRTGAGFAGHSEGLAQALEKLGSYSRRVPMDANPSTAHMFIVNPLSGGSRLLRLFSTHPPLEERIARLRGIRPPAGGPPPQDTITREDQGRAMWDRLSK